MKTLVILMMLTSGLIGQTWVRIPPYFANKHMSYELKWDTERLTKWKYWYKVNYTDDYVLADSIMDDNSTYKKFSDLGYWKIEAVIFWKNTIYIDSTDTIDYEFTTYTITGIDEIKEKEEEKVYYDLQGRVVNYLERNNIYIVKQGITTYKIYYE